MIKYLCFNLKYITFAKHFKQVIKMEKIVNALIGGSSIILSNELDLIMIDTYICHDNNLLIDISYKNTPQDEVVLKELKNEKCTIIFIGQAIPDFEKNKLQNAIDKKILTCACIYGKSPFFVYFVRESLTDEEVISLQSAYDLILSTYNNEQNKNKKKGSPNVKKKFTKSERKRMKK